ncbi:MAG: glucose-6-phosphate dehydrogenase [Candidatus Harrisonbacteria bacterium CG10_big_fil_rev_8_21_14_0_10_42_17]|uniref:Glucose-6-phosphate 1-dehydrogenase n=1 Tax=Candidatus Harrisonbacteria bacterium CG10_big_fil_rev_8_21_14_0_10_42_17 TaxID=1974584 RepID=A0A2M6WHE8_9BACT|nr:MAG: glucose-6-phosphate dehydrogenase [Candidatus Harrisonbacteria bacterium CG10_big_fil_rev_8_21_14_0_10_42_17]
MENQSIERFTVPTILVIFGITGDLSRRKLLPALFDLFSGGFLPERFKLVGFARSTYSDEEFRTFVRDALQEQNHNHSEDQLNAFLGTIHYTQGLFDNLEAYQQLSKRLGTIDDTLGQCTNKLFYLAVPPKFYEELFEHLADSGLTIPCSNEEGWTRVLVEKPFGKDVETARKLDAKLSTLFKEEQIFRIDHYLAKETVQNILAFRFSNIFFEPVWNSIYIDHVRILLSESIGVDGRGNFYDDVGAIRDVGQNHLLQLLALVAMEHPGTFAADAIRRERVNVFQSLEPITLEATRNHVRLGQYRGYQDVPGVQEHSKTETYFSLRVFLNNERWKGVPFLIEGGKKLKEHKTEVVISFKEPTPCLCRSHEDEPQYDVLTFRIQPDEGISIRFWAKRPGFGFVVEPRELSFSYADPVHSEQLRGAYQKILFDCIRGDQTLFARSDELDLTWKFITPILEHRDTLELMMYEQGSEPLTND